MKNIDALFTDAKGIENKLNTKLDFLSTQIQHNLLVNINKKVVDFKKEVNREYYKALRNIFNLNKRILEQAPVDISNAGVEEIRRELSQNLLEAKWAKQKIKEGAKIVNKGVEVIDYRNELHRDMLKREKQGENIEKMREQIKAFDWIIKKVKE